MTNQILALPMECWRWVPGYEGIYQVSTRGRVRSVGRWIIGRDGKKRFWKDRILKPILNNNGYFSVMLSHDGEKRIFRVNRLVAMAWIDNTDNKPQVNHLDENPRNNDVYNLSWATAKENSNFGTRNKRVADSLLNGKQAKPVQALDPKTGEVVLEFPSTCEAGRNGFNQQSVSLCCQDKKYKSHRGLVWRYKDDYDQENAWTPVKIGMDSQSKPVQAVDPETGEVVLEFQSIAEAGRNGFNHANIWFCCRGKRKTHKGYKWRYKP